MKNRGERVSLGDWEPRCNWEVWIEYPEMRTIIACYDGAYTVWNGITQAETHHGYDLAEAKASTGWYLTKTGFAYCTGY